MEDEDMKYCKICLVTDCKMFSSPSISEAYSQLVQDVFCADYKLYVCYECKHLLSKCQEFRSKCMTALKLLSSIHSDYSKIPKRIVREIDRKHFKLESKVCRSSMLLVCNSNILPETRNLDPDIKIEIDDTNPDALEEDKSETKFDIDAEDKDPCSDSDIKIDTKPITLGDNECEKIFYIDAEDVFYDVETHDTDYPNDIIQSSHANNIVAEIKPEQKCQPKTKKTKENVPNKIKTLKRITKKNRNLDVLPSSTSSFLRSAPSQKMMRMMQIDATIDVMTPSEAKEEMLLRKESRNYKTSPYKCELCYKGFILKSTYNNHMNHHSPDSGTVECEFCHRLFRTRNILMNHIGVCHKYKITCKSCSYVCFSPAQAKSHFAIHKGQTYTCDLCGMHFRISNTLSNHKRRLHPDVACAYCGSTFATLAGLKIHKSRAHNQDSTELLGPQCEECDVQFASETAWKRHLVRSSKHTVRNGCEICGETFLTADELRSHVKEHPQRLNKRVYYAKIAEMYKTEPNFKPAVCKLCDKWLESYGEYKEHMKSEHRNTAAAKEVVKRQAEVDDMKNICEKCGKEFKSLLLLKYHTMKHTGERPYECDQCDKKYSYPASLNNHKVHYHSGAPQFQCDDCQRTFHIKAALKRHIMIVHLGLRKFQCEICNKSCGHPCEVRYHMEYVHFKKPWPKRDRTKRRNKKD